MLNRRSLITGLISLVAAPAIVRPTSIMRIKSLDDWQETWELRDYSAGFTMVKARWEPILKERMDAVTRQALCASLYGGDNQYERLNVLRKL